MSNFSFADLATTSFSNDAPQYLKPYDIYQVNLTKIEKSELNGKDGVTKYPVMTLEFKGSGDNKGVFTQNIFIPVKDEDFVRNENSNTHNLMPSRFDQFQYTLMQIVEAINPSGAQKIKDNASRLKTIDDFTKLVLKALTGKDTVDVYLKLVGQNTNGTVYARLPNACLIGKDGNISAVNFINPDNTKLYFTNYEIGQMKSYKEAKPTNMDVDVDTKDEQSLDLEGIEI